MHTSINKELKREYARLIAIEISENLEPKDIESIKYAKEEIRNRLIENKLNNYIYKGENKI